MTNPAIHIVKDGPIFRVQIIPPLELDPSTRRPETYAGKQAALNAAKWLSVATGLPIIEAGKGLQQ